MGRIKEFLDFDNKKTNDFIFKFFLFVLVFVLVVPKFPFVNISKTFVAIRVEDLLIAILVLIWFLSYFKKIKELINKNITKAILLFWFIGFVSLISAYFITHTIVPHLGLLHWLRRVEVMSLFFVAATVIRTRKQVMLLLKILFVANIFIVLYGFGQIYLEFPVISTTNSEFSKGQILRLTPGARTNSTFAGHYDLAVYLSFVLIFLGSLFFYYKKLWQKGIIAFSGGLTFLLLGFTAARVSFVATLVSLTVAFLLMGKRILIGLLFLAAVLVLIINPELRHRLMATVTVNILEGGGPKYTPPQNQVTIFTPDKSVSVASKEAVIREATSSSTESAQKSSTISADIAPGEPINTTELGVYRSFNIRTDVEWPRAMRAFYKNPLLGSGYSSISLATDNDYLRSLGEMGILGTLSLALVFFILIKRIYFSLKLRSKFERLLMISTLGTVMAVLITSVFIDVLEASKVAIFFWSIMGVAWAMSERELEGENS